MLAFPLIPAGLLRGERFIVGVKDERFKTDGAGRVSAVKRVGNAEKRLRDAAERAEEGEEELNHCNPCSAAKPVDS